MLYINGDKGKRSNKCKLKVVLLSCLLKYSYLKLIAQSLYRFYNASLVLRVDLGVLGVELLE
jgi:hypothetical protein